MALDTTIDAPVIIWFRFDLRLDDHAGVAAALETQRPVLPVFIWDETCNTRPLGAASRWWLHRSLEALDKDLQKRKSRLIFLRGPAPIVLASLAQETLSKTIVCSRTFDPRTEEGDNDLSEGLSELGVRLHRWNTSLLAEPGLLKTKEEKAFRVFTPFSRALQGMLVQVDSLPTSSTNDWRSPVRWPDSLTVANLGLDSSATPSGGNWASGFTAFTPGAAGAQHCLQRFLADDLVAYGGGRDRPDHDLTSHLSPHLRFGEISPRRILAEVDKAAVSQPDAAASAAKFYAELIWRDFNYNILYQQPELHQRNFRADFDSFPWRHDPAGFRAWTRGETGFPLVDAGMRELWQTGFMHNRVRMVTASFLTKHLLIDWRLGEQWFWDCLLDADPASNPGNWQWVAGCGADATPYFRIFNPSTQAEKFDPDAAYRRRFLGAGTNRLASQGATQSDLFDAGRASAAYPAPIVDHTLARERALQAYKTRGEED